MRIGGPLRRRAKNLLSVATPQLVGSNVTGVLVTTRDGDRLIVDHRDYGVGYHLRYHGEFCAAELSSLRSAAKGFESALVVGAHVGAFAIPLARMLRRVAAIEANPDTFRLLAMNIVLNDLTNVDLHEVAASDHDGQLEFVKNVANSGGSKMRPAFRDRAYYDDRPEACVVECRRLDDIFVDERFDLIVIDIEGSEVDALRGMPRLLEEATVVSIEFVPHHLTRVADTTIDAFVEPLLGFDTASFRGQTVGVRSELRSVLTDLHQESESVDSIILRRT